MGRFYEKQGLCWFTDGELEIPLDENNLLAYLHRDEPLKDKVAVEDPRDEEWWFWFRYDTVPEDFKAMVGLAQRIGTVIMRSTPTVQVNKIFDNQHQFTDTDYEELLNGTN